MRPLIGYRLDAQPITCAHSSWNMASFRHVTIGWPGSRLGLALRGSG